MPGPASSRPAAFCLTPRRSPEPDDQPVPQWLSLPSPASPVIPRDTAVVGARARPAEGAARPSRRPHRLKSTVGSLLSQPRDRRPGGGGETPVGGVPPPAPQHPVQSLVEGVARNDGRRREKAKGSPGCTARRGCMAAYSYGSRFVRPRDASPAHLPSAGQSL